MGQDLVRQITFHYQSGFTFTSCLTSFTSKYVVYFMNNIIHLNMIISSVPFEPTVNKILVKYLLLQPIADLLQLDLHWTKKDYTLLAKIFHPTLKNFIPITLCLWNSKTTLLYVYSFIHLVFILSIV